MAIEAAERRKISTDQELMGPHSRAKLVMLAVEVGGRWSEQSETGDPFDDETRRAGMAASMAGHVGLRRGEGSGVVIARFVAPPRR